jgi:hypothetical protein
MTEGRRLSSFPTIERPRNPVLDLKGLTRCKPPIRPTDSVYPPCPNGAETIQRPSHQVKLVFVKSRCRYELEELRAYCHGLTVGEPTRRTRGFIALMDAFEEIRNSQPSAQPEPAGKRSRSPSPATPRAVLPVEQSARSNCLYVRPGTTLSYLCKTWATRSVQSGEIGSWEPSA